MSDVVSVMLTDLEKIISDFKDILESHGVELDSSRLSELVKKVKHLKTLRPNRDYAGLVKDKNGYIIKAFRLSDFFELNQLPKDVSRGYYKLIDDKIVLDEERQRQIEGV